VRIIAGEWRGRVLKAPPGDATRPTADRVRETLFSMLVSRIGSFDGLRVADLFAGSGALGLEALSRGAAHATFVEQDSAALAALRANCDHFKADDRVRIIAGSALKLPTAEPFDLILADPPYRIESGSKAVTAIATAGWLAPAGWMSIETARGDAVDPGAFEIEAERDVGRARITLMRSRPISR
jgi:16S rRNA (guanine966-N2)-methyltransferase